MKEYKMQGLRGVSDVEKTPEEIELYEAGMENFVKKMDIVRAESISMSIKSRISASRVILR